MAWLSDIVPHMVYGAVTASVFQAMRRRRYYDEEQPPHRVETAAKIISSERLRVVRADLNIVFVEPRAALTD
jgi:hypothetical protein